MCGCLGRFQLYGPSQFLLQYGGCCRRKPRGGTGGLESTRHDFIEFIVDDEGPGIPPEQRDLIFERFHRLAGNEKPGSGIGLYLVRALVEAHGGTIDVLDGTRGYGTRFVVCIPRVAVPAS